MLRDNSLKPKSGGVTRARKLRKAMTLPEVLLWQYLGGQPNGVKFRRQHPSSDFQMDFYCNDARLCIETDGISYEMGDLPGRDIRWDSWLNSQGIETLRFAATEILKDAQGVADRMMQAALQRLPLHHPAVAGRSPSPRQARGG